MKNSVTRRSTSWFFGCRGRMVSPVMSSTPQIFGVWMLVVAAVAGCGTTADRPASPIDGGPNGAAGEGVITLSVSVALDQGADLGPINYSIVCNETAKNGTWEDVGPNSVFTRVIPGVVSGASCSIALSGRDSSSPGADNCFAAARNITARGHSSVAHLSFVCRNDDVQQGLHRAGPLGTFIGPSVVRSGASLHQCAALASYTVSPDNAGSSFELSLTATSPFNTDGSPADEAINTSWVSSTGGPNGLALNVVSSSVSPASSAATFLCTSPGTHLVTAAVQDTFANGAGLACGTNVVNFQIVCPEHPIQGTGGASSMGGTSALGGASQGSGGTSSSASAIQGGTSGTGGATQGGTSGTGGTGQISIGIVIAPGIVLSSIDYLVECGDFIRDGTWNLENSSVVSGVVGGMPEGASCSVSLSGRDSSSPEVDNCFAAIRNITASGNVEYPTSANLSLVCIQHSIDSVD